MEDKERIISQFGTISMCKDGYRFDWNETHADKSPIRSIAKESVINVVYDAVVRLNMVK